MNLSRIGILVQLLALLSFSAHANAYNEIDVANGGTITGVVKVKGKIPGDEMKTVSKNKTQCGETIAAERYVVSAAGEVKWAVAMLEGIGEGKKLDKTAEVLIDNHSCRFSPHVLVAPTGGKLSVKNSDEMLHNSHFFLIVGDKKRNVINLALPKKDQVIAKSKILRKPGLLSVECDAHDFMQGYVWSLPHPYGAVTDDRGRFSLTDVPPGTHTLKIWHEALGAKTLPVEVKSGKETKVVIEYEL